MSYREGLGFAELCLEEVDGSNGKPAVLERIRCLLGSVKEHKIDRIKDTLGTSNNYEISRLLGKFLRFVIAVAAFQSLNDQ